MGGDRYKMRMHDGTDPNAPLSWWEGWPMTAVAILVSAAIWSAKLSSLLGMVW